MARLGKARRAPAWPGEPWPGAARQRLAGL